MFALWPSRKVPMASAAPLAALERRLAGLDEGGGVARDGWGCEGSVWLASLKESDADRWTVTTDAEESEGAREDEERRRWCWW